MLSGNNGVIQGGESALTILFSKIFGCSTISTIERNLKNKKKMITIKMITVFIEK